MKVFILLAGSLLGFLAVVLGAFGAHAFKKFFSEEIMKSFETGVKYQMYHSLLLLLLGFEFGFESEIQKYMAWSFICGIFLFSFSIYALCMGRATKRNWKFLGPITPLGGLLLIIGWVLLFFSVLEI